MEQHHDHHKFGMFSKTGSSRGNGHPIMFGKPKKAILYDDFPEGGGYPKGFLEWAFETIGVKDQQKDKVLHLCSGSLRTGVRVDIRPSTHPDYVADCRNVPLADESFEFIMADPPYSEQWAENLYQTGSSYPKPYDIVKESCRLLKPGGLLGLMYFQVPYFRKPMKLVGVWGITQGIGYNIRAWSLLKKGV